MQFEFNFTRSFILEGKRRQQPFVISIAVKEYLNEQIDKRKQEIAVSVKRNSGQKSASPACASESGGRSGEGV